MELEHFLCRLFIKINYTDLNLNLFDNFHGNVNNKRIVFCHLLERNCFEAFFFAGSYALCVPSTYCRNRIIIVIYKLFYFVISL